MPRIAGINIPDNKRIEIALAYIYGIGPTLGTHIVTQVGVDPNKRANKLTAEELNRIKEYIEKHYKIEGDLKREIMLNVKRLKDIKAYRGVRHMRGLPVRGQRTKTNSRTRRGNTRKTAGSGRRSVDKK
ncbi:30S ribosomal protein S13 [Candidatus Azambacteria bacterium RIFCSPHIGHO2_02_FULL_52_12]|uniref:Small ribosomal subunit protein uS13 n=1 Tax=Candidatus Azambacteria bacterium RIFCSPLOWO2_01_FULL_46_25 TaxID=1797298 RepID=A0A1F5BTJ9_9BACT|nr:MAG: 30S ribosomal protein S13 [Candidatus Azambacteria bacterium RIFCSPHIGHO2_02_FULL_52_12]OGD33894.1 MAG: 30S ribosomal protein S13 [Candidatus Azambacteria bacterium RIFCSPLOWO2_01_FULL_46_25]OGD37956.1 MAG: 30S ribosomal protein S13 [Candidatus Azambacteria bacterium RIFCSPHIGHO2_01_FULL_51_74]